MKSNLSGEFTVVNPYLISDLKDRGYAVETVGNLAALSEMNASAALRGAARPPNSPTRAPRISQAGRAIPGGWRPGQKRWTRPSWFVKVPSCSANVVMLGISAGIQSAAALASAMAAPPASATARTRTPGLAEFPAVGISIPVFGPLRTSLLLGASPML